MPEASLTAEQRQRYARHLALAEIGPNGQRRLLRSSVLIVGVGALGSPVALYLAAAGVGTIGLADHDHVRLSNLQRQVIHSMAGLNRSKVDGAARTVGALNPDVKVDAIEATVDEHNAMDVLQRYDVIVDGTDTFHARYLLSDTAYLLRKPLVHGSIFRIEGQVTVFTPGRGCYRCLYPEPPPAGAIEESEDVGVFAALPGIIGTIQAAETIKLISQEQLFLLIHGATGRLLAVAKSRIENFDVGSLCGHDLSEPTWYGAAEVEVKLILIQ